MDNKRLPTHDEWCEVHESIKTDHCPVCLLNERDRLRAMTERDKDGVPYIDVAAEDVPEWAEYLAAAPNGVVSCFGVMPNPYQKQWASVEGEYDNFYGQAVPWGHEKYAITDQPFFLTLRRIRRV